MVIRVNNALLSADSARPVLLVALWRQVT